MRECGLLAGACSFGALGFLITGLFAPALTVTEFWIFEDTFSILSGIWTLWETGERLLFIILIVFSVLFPTIKAMLLVVLSLQSNNLSKRRERLLKRLSFINKFSMLDVFVAAFFVILVKIKSLVDVEVRSGIFLFTASVLLGPVNTIGVLRQ